MAAPASARLILVSLASLCLAAPSLAAERSERFPDIPYATWTDSEPQYRLYPGDEIDVAVPGAPELNRTVVVQPDGRVTMPLIAPVMAADRSVEQLQDALAEAYSGELRDPQVQVSVKIAQALKVFVGGEVGKPGVYDMVGDMDALRAIIDAGGFTASARQSEVVIIRRGPDGRPMMRTVDMRRALKRSPEAEMVPLRRFDIVYVPKSRVAEAGQFVQQYIRDLIPGQMGFSYSLGGQGIYTGVP